MTNPTQSHDTLVIGGGQAGLTTGYYLQRAGRDFVILDAHDRIGDAWRKRWDSLRLFTPNRYNGLVGMPFPGPAGAFATKDEMADYLEAYAARFQLPVRTSVRVDRLSRQHGRLVVEAGSRRFEAENVIVAMANYQTPRLPAYAGELDPGIVQLHAGQYRSPSQLQPGAVLIVGAGNSGAEIAVELVRTRPTWLSGRDIGHLPFRLERPVGRLLAPIVARVVFHRLMTMKTPLGRKARAQFTRHGMPLVRVKPGDLAAAGVQRVPRVAGVRGGLPALDDGRVLDVPNVIWCTGFDPGFTWIDLPILRDGEPVHERGVVASEPGLYFVGLHFLYAASSAQIHGVARDAEFAVRTLQSRQPARRGAGAAAVQRRPGQRPASPAADEPARPQTR